MMLMVMVMVMVRWFWFSSLLRWPAAPPSSCLMAASSLPALEETGGRRRAFHRRGEPSTFHLEEAAAVSLRPFRAHLWQCVLPASAHLQQPL